MNTRQLAAELPEHDRPGLPQPPAGPRCTTCGYRTDALGHLTKCPRGKQGATA